MRGQVVLEFVALTTILMLILVVVVLSSSFVSVAGSNLQTASVGERLCSSVASEINTASVIGDGYERWFSLPYSLPDGSAYSITVIGLEYGVYGLWTGGNCRASISTSEVSGSVAPGRNRIRNVGGAVVIG